MLNYTFVIDNSYKLQFDIFAKQICRDIKNSSIFHWIGSKWIKVGYFGLDTSNINTILIYQNLSDIQEFHMVNTVI